LYGAAHGIETQGGQNGIGMQKQQNIPCRMRRSQIHLSGPPRRAVQHVRRELAGDVEGLIGATAIDHNEFVAWG
jgi:hypothetical protein